MRFNLVQIEKELYAARFEVRKGTEKIGAVNLQGKMGSIEAVVSGNFYGRNFVLNPGKSSMIKGMPFRPYQIKLNDLEVGAVYQTEFKLSFFKKVEFQQIILGDKVYDIFGIGFGEEGGKCPIYQGDRQIALIEKDCIVYDDLHHYDVYVIDENTGFISLLVCLYMYLNACYEPGQKVKLGKCKYVSVTRDKFLLGKYNPDFKKTISD